MPLQELLTAAGAGALTLGALGTAPLDQGCLGHYLQTITNGTSWLGASLDRLDAPAIDPAAAAAVAVSGWAGKDAGKYEMAKNQSGGSGSMCLGRCVHRIASVTITSDCGLGENARA